MPPEDLQTHDDRHRRLSRHFHLAGSIVLGVGLLSAVLVYWLAPDNSASGGYDPNDDKVYQFQMERIGGKSVLIAAEINRWLAGLWQGRPLAYTLAVLSVVIALVCFWIAHRLEEED